MNGLTKIQLIGDVEGFLDTSDNISLPLTISIADIRDITKRNGFFSKTVVLPGTANNNQLLGYYFDVNLSQASYSINKLQECVLIQDGIILLNNTYLQLIAVRKRQSIQTGDDIIEYEVLIKDQISNFFTTINNKELKDLDFSEFNHNYTSANIVSSFSHNWTDGYKYFLPYREIPVGYVQGVRPGIYRTPTSPIVRGYFTNELFPAIYMMEYWKKIHEQAGFSYEFVDFDEYLVGADKLLVTDNASTETLLREVNEFISIKAKIDAEDDVTVTYALPTDDQFLQGDNYQLSLYLSDDVKDLNNKWTSYLETTSTYPLLNTTPTVTVSPSLQKGYSIWESEFILSQARPKISVSLDYVFSIYNTDTSNSAYFVQGNPDPYFQLFFQIVDTLGNVVAQQQLQNINISTTPILPLSAETMFSTDVPVTTQFLLTDGSIGDLFAFRLFLKPIAGTKVGGGVLNINFDDNLGNPVDVIPRLTIRSAMIDITYNSVPYNATFPINSVIPTKVKQSDFIKSIITMYNLYCIVDKDDNSKLIWKRRDQFYDEGPVLDWESKLDRSQFQEITFLPELSSKKFTFTYKQDDDVFNTNYFKATKEIYGQQEVILSSEWIKDQTTNELIFSPTPMTWTDLGVPGITVILPTVSLNPGESNMRLLYDGGQQELGIGNNIYIIDSTLVLGSDLILELPGLGSGIFTEVNTYPLTTHCSSAYGGPGSIDINFGVCDYYLFSAFQPTQNNLYNLNWKRTMEQLDNSKMLTGYFSLNALEISNLDLSSKIKCMNTYWYINKIIDYDANSKKLTKVELISIDTDVDIS